MSLIRQELSSPMFDLTESSNAPSDNNNETENDGKGTQIIDINATFSPRPRWFCFLAKFSLVAVSISFMYESITMYEHPDFWLSYLTHWAWTTSVAYFVCSFLSAIYLAKRGKMESFTGFGGFFVKATWALFAIALPAEIVTTILFWALEYKGTLTHVSAMLHGGGVFLLLLDGFAFSRIPIRMKQFYLYETFAAIYLTWNIIHAFSGIGNPYTDEGSDDAIYRSMNWKDNPDSSAIIGLATLLVLNPIVFLFCRGFSRMIPKRLLSGDDGVDVGMTYKMDEELETV